jgi:cytochrome P450
MTDAIVSDAGAAEQFDPTSSEYRADPYAIYRRLLDRARVHRSVLDTPVLVRHADCLAVLHHPEASSDQTKSTEYAQAVEAGLFDPDSEMLEARPFLFLDPPDHTRLRRLVSKAFTPRRIEELRPRISEIVEELLAPIHDGATVDIIETLAYPVPVRAICGLLGVPPEDHERFGQWSRPLARSLDPDFILPPEAVAARDQALAQFHDYFRELIVARRGQPGDDLLSALIEAEDAGDRLTEQEVLATLTLLLVAGHETTVNLIANGVHSLLRNPEELGRLRADRSLVPSMVEEVLRWDPPVQLDGRTMLADVDVDGLHFTSGQTVLLVIAAANRDARVFRDPDRFDIGRPDIPHVSFGHGMHHCLGAALARAEGQIALAALVEAFSSWELATDQVTYKENLVLRGLEALPVRLAR